MRPPNTSIQQSSTLNTRIRNKLAPPTTMIKWLDIVDQHQLQDLITAYNLPLTNATRTFLESFARLVNNASTARQALVHAAIQRKTHLHTVNSIIAQEVAYLQSQFPNSRIVPYRHPETSLPIVYVRIPAVPDLVVHIYRSYAQSRKRLAFGFRAYSFCRGHLTGPLARATNYLRARCQAHSWNFSLTDLVSLWCQQIAAIPLQERLPSRNNNPKMLRRRRRDNNPDSPPRVHDPLDHASIPQNHPKTDVLIKDDKLFPNRTFNDPEELYAEQVRAIRKKRKLVPGVLDDYELAWRKRRPVENTYAPHQLYPPQNDLQLSPQAEVPLSQPAALGHSSLFPVGSSADGPSEPDVLVTPATNRPESPEEPEFSFVNPLSPELRHSSGDDSPPSPTTQAQMDHQIQDQDVARMEAAERAVLSKPATTKNITSSTPLDADNANCINDDNSPSLFFFSTASDAHAPPVAPTTQVPAEEEVTVEEKADAAVTAPPPEEKEEPVVVAPVVTEKTDQVTDAPQAEVTQRSQEDGSTLLAEQLTEQDAKSGEIDKENVVEPSFSFGELFDDQGVSQVDDVRKEEPKTGGEGATEEERERQADSNSPLDSGVKDVSKQSLPSKTVEEPPKEADAKDEPSKQQTTGIEPPSNTGRLSDSSFVTPKESKKRSREICPSDDIVVVDPDTEEENEKSAKKRRFEKPIISGNETLVSPPHNGIGSPVRDPKNERPSPRNIDVSTPERTVRTPETDTEKSQETKPAHEVARPSIAKEVTPDVDIPSPNPFLSYKAVSIPAGVERDPCPMALSEPSESSEYSSDRGSNSDAESSADEQPDER